jgi:hypothetical protein
VVLGSGLYLWLRKGAAAARSTPAPSTALPATASLEGRP